MEKNQDNGTILPKYDLKGWIKAFVLGIFIGLAVIVPGVSGSTVAIMFGLYAAMLYAIGNVTKDFKRCIKFLIPIGVGLVIGFIGGFVLVKILLEKYIFVVICLFVGLMLGASPALLNEIKGERVSAKRVILMIAGVAIPLAVGAISVYLEPPVLTEIEGASQAFTSYPWYRYLLYLPLGFVIAATQLIPGLSATAITMALGQFKPIMDSVSFSYWRENPHFVIPFLGLMLCLGAGLVIGLVVISKLFSRLIAKHKGSTFFFVVGLSFGSIASMFLNPDIVQIYFNWGHGKFSAIEFAVGIILLAVGLIGSALLTKYGLVHEAASKESAEANDEKKENE